MKQPVEWTPEWQTTFGDLCASRWGFRYKFDDNFSLREVVERAYQASDARSLESFAELLGTLPDSDPEVQAFIGQMVVGETSFFRNKPQFDALQTTILPELFESRHADGTRKIRIWSAGCASGEEPYSIAILIATMLPDWQKWDIRIFATDINPFALRRAQDAIYSDWSFREAGPEGSDAFFMRVSSLRKLEHPCKSMVQFRRQNLATDPIPDEINGLADLDVIFCRNVTIYFGRDLTAVLASKLFEALKPGGWLVVGHTEPDSAIYRQFECVDFPDTVIYRRPGAERPAPRRDSTDTQTPDTPGPRIPLPADPVSQSNDPPVAEPEVPAIETALFLYELHDFRAAYEVLARRATACPTDVIAPHMLAQVSADEKRYDEALYWGFTALQRDAFHVPTLMLMGLVFLETRESDRARELFQQAVFNDAQCPEAHLYLSMAYRELGRPEQERRSRHRAERLAAAVPDTVDGLLPVQRARVHLRDSA